MPRHRETPDRAAVREAKEELGLDPKSLAVHFLHEDAHDHPDGTPREFSVYYARLSSSSRATFILDSDEVADTKWTSLDEVRRLLREEPQTILISNNAALWGRLLDQLQPFTGNTKV